MRYKLKLKEFNINGEKGMVKNIAVNYPIQVSCRKSLRRRGIRLSLGKKIRDIDKTESYSQN